MGLLPLEGSAGAGLLERRGLSIDARGCGIRCADTIKVPGSFHFAPPRFIPAYGTTRIPYHHCASSTRHQFGKWDSKYGSTLN